MQLCFTLQCDPRKRLRCFKELQAGGKVVSLCTPKLTWNWKDVLINPLALFSLPYSFPFVVVFCSHSLTVLARFSFKASLLCSYTCTGLKPSRQPSWKCSESPMHSLWIWRACWNPSTGTTQLLFHQLKSKQHWNRCKKITRSWCLMI